MYLREMLPHQLEEAVAKGYPLLLPAGCIEYHGPHMPLGNDTILVEELMARVAERVECVIAPAIYYGPASYAVSGPEKGSLNVDNDAFARHVKEILRGFCEMGFRWIIVGIHHQGLEGPEALAFRRAAAELHFELAEKERGRGWWGRAPMAPDDNAFSRIQVWPSVFPKVEEAGVKMADHAGFYETSLLLAVRPEMVDMSRLGPDVPWFSKAEGSDAAQARAEEGERMMGLMVEAWVEALNKLRGKENDEIQGRIGTQR